MVSQMFEKQIVQMGTDYLKELDRKGQAKIIVHMQAHPEDEQFYKVPPSCNVLIKGGDTDVKKPIAASMTRDERSFIVEVESIKADTSNIKRVLHNLSQRLFDGIKEEIDIEIIATPEALWENRYEPFTFKGTFSAGQEHSIIINLAPKKKPQNPTDP